MGMIATGLAALGSGSAATGAMYVGGAMGLLQGIMGGGAEQAQWAAQETARRKQKIELVKAMNWEEASYRLDLRNLLDEAVDGLTEINFAAIRNRSTVNAAVSESGMEGRSVNAVKRSVEAQSLRAASRLTENYERDYASILAEREQAWMASRAQVEGVGGQIKKPSTGGQLLNTLSSTISGAMGGHALGSRMKVSKPKQGGKDVK